MKKGRTVILEDKDGNSIVGTVYSHRAEEILWEVVLTNAGETENTAVVLLRGKTKAQFTLYPPKTRVTVSMWNVVRSITLEEGETVYGWKTAVESQEAELKRLRRRNDEEDEGEEEDEEEEEEEESEDDE